MHACKQSYFWHKIISFPEGKHYTQLQYLIGKLQSKYYQKSENAHEKISWAILLDYWLVTLKKNKLLCP